MDIDTLLEVGFGDEELSDIWDNMEITEDNFQLEEAIEKAKTTKIKKGELYQMGDHRLMCGDATKKDDVKKLMGRVKADMIFCDPPYNIGLDYSNGIGTNKKYGGSYSAKNDSLPSEKYTDFLDKTIKNILLFSNKNVHAFYWCDERSIWLIQNLFKENGLDNKRVCMWIKNNASPTPQMAFNKVYEPCIYATIGRPFLNPNYRNFTEILNKEIEGGNQTYDEIQDLFNLWIVKRDPTSEYEHPTQKPITLCQKPIRRCTGPGNIVVDLFGGSGSTLMACEQSKRKCFMMEIDPIFAQVIINRWQEYNGDQAKKIN
jgi:DNA modification methylase